MTEEDSETTLVIQGAKGGKKKGGGAEIGDDDDTTNGTKRCRKDDNEFIRTVEAQAKTERKRGNRSNKECGFNHRQCQAVVNV